MPVVRKPSWLACALALLMLAAAVPVAAQTSETVEGLGPKDGDWELDYVGQFAHANGSNDERQHSGQSFYGVTDWLALGGETKLAYRSGPLVREDRLYFDYDSAVAIVRFSQADEDPVGLGLWLQAGLDSDGELARLEARLIAEKRTRSWWAQGNVIVRRVNEGREEGTHLAYAARLSHAVADDVWLGVEASGQAAELGGFHRRSFEKAQYLGPMVGHEIALGGDNRLRLNVTWLRRLDEREGARDLFQLTAALKF